MNVSFKKKTQNTHIKINNNLTPPASHSVVFTVILYVVLSEEQHVCDVNHKAQMSCSQNRVTFVFFSI